jgi:outer membrane protein assembly factor BamB
VSVAPRDGDVYAATGNSLNLAEDTGYAERVVRLSRRLRVRQSNHPFRRVSVADQDFGSTPLLYRARGCPAQLAALNKDGELLVYRRDRIGRGPAQRLRIAGASSTGFDSLLGLPVFDAPRRMLYVVSPSDPRGGPRRRGLLGFKIGRRCRLALAWRNDSPVKGLAGPAVVAGGVVAFETGLSGMVHLVDAATGRTLTSLWLGGAAGFAAPTIADGTLFAADWQGVVRAFAPAAGG